MKFLRDNAWELRSRFRLIATAGTWVTITRTGYFDDKHIERLLPGAQGGILQIAYRVVTGKCSAVIFLYDPEEVRSESHETRALTRVSIYKRIPLLTTVASADHWLKYESKAYSPPRAIPWPVVRAGRPGTYHELRRQPDCTIALIAHDAKKKEMRELLRDDLVRTVVERDFGRVLATGTTGALLRGWFPELAPKVVLANSGPEGGDVQIAHEVLVGHCQVVAFLHDPLTAHPHEADIHLLRRACQLPAVSPILLSDLDSATSWARSCVRLSRPRFTLAEQMRRRFPVLKEALIIPRGMIGTPLQTRQRIRGTASGWGLAVNELAAADRAWRGVMSVLLRVTVPYVDSILRRNTAGTIGMLVNWGLAMQLLADAIREVRPAPRHRLLVGPMGGVPGGAVFTEQSANRIAETIAKAYGAEHWAIDDPIFRRDHDPLSADQKRRLGDAEIVLTSIGPIPPQRRYAREIKLALDPKVGREVVLRAIRARAVGEIGGIIFGEFGKGTKLPYRPVGLQPDALRAIAARGRVIAIVGGDPRRPPAVRAALDGGLCSVLVTDEETAEKVLRDVG